MPCWFRERLPPRRARRGSERGRFAFQANGARESTNSFLYDGVYVIDPILNSFSFTPPVDAVREFRIQTSNSEAGLGRNSGSQIAVGIKQGTNAVHGTVYEFVRNNRLDARNFFTRPDDPAPTLRRNQFGFSLGGPIARDATFFFVDYEGLRENRAVTRTTNVLTLAERTGDFSNSLVQPPIDFFTGQPFPNGKLPFLHPVGQGVAGLYPEPNRSAPGKTSSPPRRETTARTNSISAWINAWATTAGLRAATAFPTASVSSPTPRSSSPPCPVTATTSSSAAGT